MYVEGITSQEKINEYGLDYPRKEICLNFQCRIPEEKQDIDKIEKIILDYSIIEDKFVQTQNQNKIFFQGFIDIKIIYISPQENTDMDYYDIRKSFGSFVPVEFNGLDGGDGASITGDRASKKGASKKEPIVFIEEALINRLNSREISVSLLMLAGTIYRKNQEKKNIDVPLKIKEENIKIDNTTSKNVDIELEYDMSKENGFFEIRWE